jgi:gamma-glutamyltranspeptidase/glutathione hydrolase
MFRSRLFAGAAGLLLLAGCVSKIENTLGLEGSQTATASGLVVGDEPYAVRAGASLLAEGGSAADAATATYFAMAATYPVAAALGGGGICVVHDPARGNAEFDFLARDPSAGGAYAVPGSVRGFALLQSAFGTLPFQRDVSAGEELAAAGFPISAALAERLKAAENIIRLDAGLSSEFIDEAGQIKTAGAVVKNPELAQTLSLVRTLGPQGFYSGETAAKIMAYSNTQSGAIAPADFTAYRATKAEPRALAFGDHTVLLPAESTGAGAFAGALFEDLDHIQSTTSTDDFAAAMLLAVKRTLVRFKIESLPADLGATGFAARDASGQVVACAVTMNGPFGSGHTARGTGVVLSRAPSSSQAGISAAFLTPVVDIDTSGDPVLTGSGAGGPNGTAAIAYAALRLSRGESILSAKDLHSTGAAPYDTVNAITCQGNLCTALPDPGARGLGISAEAVK